MKRSGRLLDSSPKICGFEPYQRHCVVSLSKTHLSLLSTGLTKEDITSETKLRGRFVGGPIKAQDGMLDVISQICNGDFISIVQEKRFFIPTRLTNCTTLVPAL